MGCDVGVPNRRRIRAVLPAEVEIRDLYSLASRVGVQIRQLDYKRDSLEDIFLRAMEDEPPEGAPEKGAPKKGEPKKNEGALA